MNTKKFIPIVAVLLVIAAGIAFAVYEKSQSNPNNNTQPANIDRSGIILFYGNGCPHCANVEKFIKENKVDEKVSFKSLEVYSNKDNANLLMEIATECKLPTDSIGIPFLWDGPNMTCVVGEPDVVSFFQSKIQ